MSNTFKEWMEKIDDVKLSKTRKKMNRKRKDGSSKNVYGWDGYGTPPNISGAPAGGADGGGAVGEGLLRELCQYEDEEFSYDTPPTSYAEKARNALMNGDEELAAQYYEYAARASSGRARRERYQSMATSIMDDKWRKDRYSDEDEEEFYNDDECPECGGDEEPDWDRDDEPDTNWDEDEWGADDEFDDDRDDEFDDDRDDEFDDETEDKLSGMGTFKDFIRLDQEEDEEDDYNPRYDNVQGDRERHREDLERLRKELPYDANDPEDVGFTDEDEPDEYDPRYDEYHDEDRRDEYDYEEDPFRDDVEADADVLRNVGWGTDEDYGVFSDDGYEYDEYEEEQEEVSKKQQARGVYMQLRNAGHSRKRIIDEFERRLQLTPSSAVAYYERIAKEFGDTGRDNEDAGMMPGAMDPMAMGDLGQAGMGDDEMMGPEGEDEFQEPQEWENPNRQGVIRRVNNAHLVYKRQTDDGSFEEMWVYKQGKNKLRDELEIRRDILAGTDIPVTKTQSEDGKQQAELWSVGNVQFLNITGLPN